MQALTYADHVLFIERAGVFQEPPWVRGRVHYTGPVVKPLTYARGDRGRARSEIGCDPGAAVITVLPGSWSESMFPVLELVLDAFEQLVRRDKRLLWVAGDDFAHVRERTKADERVGVLHREANLDRLMVASDVVITKSTYVIGNELEVLGVPSIALTAGLNPIDDAYARLRSNTIRLDARETPPHELGRVIQQILDERRPASGFAATPELGGSRRAAVHLLRAFLLAS